MSPLESLRNIFNPPFPSPLPRPASQLVELVSPNKATAHRSFENIEFRFGAWRNRTCPTSEAPNSPHQVMFMYSGLQLKYNLHTWTSRVLLMIQINLATSMALVYMRSCRINVMNSSGSEAGPTGLGSSPAISGAGDHLSTSNPQIVEMNRDPNTETSKLSGNAYGCVLVGGLNIIHTLAEPEASLQIPPTPAP